MPVITSDYSNCGSAVSVKVKSYTTPEYFVSDENKGITAGILAG